MVKQCQHCGKNFNTKPCFVARGQGRFCSNECHYISSRRGMETNCGTCGVSLYRQPARIARSKSGRHFCGKSCQTKWRNREFIGSKHVNWKTGRNAYRTVLTRNEVPKVCRRCKYTDERVLATHHIDENHYNNELNNLAWLCHNCHLIVHRDKVEAQKFLADTA